MPRPTPMETHIKLDGDKELIRKFRKLEHAFSQEALVGAVTAGAKVIEREAKVRAPVKTGILRDAITSEQLKTKKNLVEVGVSWRIKKGISGAGKPSRVPAYYGIMVEKGTKSRKRKKKSKKPLVFFKEPKSTGRGPARPFLEPAFESKRQQAAWVIKDKISELIKEAVHKGA